MSDVNPEEITKNNMLRILINLKKLIKEDRDNTAERKRPKIKVNLSPSEHEI